MKTTDDPVRAAEPQDLRPSDAVTKPPRTALRSQIGYETASALSNRRCKFNSSLRERYRRPRQRRPSGNPRAAVPANRHQPQSRRQPDVGEHFERPAFIVQQRLGHAEQHADDTILTTGTANRAVVTVDLHRAHLAVL